MIFCSANGSITNKHIHATQKPQWAFFLHHLQDKMSTLPANYLTIMLVKHINAPIVIVLILMTSWPVRTTLRRNVKIAFLLVKKIKCVIVLLPSSLVPLSLVFILILYILLPSDVSRPGVPGGCEQQSGGSVGG